MAKERTCIMCMKKYKYCPTCGQSGSDKSYMYAYHDEKCMAIDRTLQLYRGKELSVDEAAERMMQYPENLADIVKCDNILANQVKEILKAAGKTPGKKQDKKTEDIKEVTTSSIDVTEEEVAESSESQTSKKRAVRKKNSD